MSNSSRKMLSLYKKCLWNVCRNMQNIINEFIEKNVDVELIFNSLPPVICEDIISYSALNPFTIRCLFRSGIKKIFLVGYENNLPTEVVSRCFLNVTYIDLSRSGISEDTLLCVISKLPNVICLELNSTTCSDVVMETIGKTCFLLENLGISDCYITDVGLYHLCHDLENYQKKHCIKLKVLKAFGSKITAKGLAYLLEHLPLCKIWTRKDVYLNSIRLFVERNFGNTCRLTELSLERHESMADLQETMSCCPYLEWLRLCKFPITDTEFIMLPQLNHLRNLYLTADRKNYTLTFDGVVYYLSQTCKQLKVLWLKNFSYVNIYLIGKYCRQLQELYLFRISHLYFKNDNYRSSNIFTSLKRVFIHKPRGNPWDNCLQSLVKNCQQLHYIRISNMSYVTDNVIIEMLPYLKTLEWFSMDYCDNVTIKSLYLLVDSLPKLKHLVVYSTVKILTSEQEKEFNEYISEHNCSVHLWYYWFSNSLNALEDNDSSSGIED